MKSKKLIPIMLLLSSLVGCGNEVSSSTNSTSSSNNVTSSEKTSSTSSVSSSVIASTSSSVVVENQMVDYEVEVKNVYGTILKGVTVSFYKDKKVVFEDKTNYYGKVVASLEQGEYQVKVSDLPKGMYLDDKIAITHEKLNEVVCLAKPIEESLPGNYYYKIGDVMYDFTIVDTSGKQVKLSELLKTKKAVVLNFWASWCEPCQEEFPHFNEAYATYKDDIEIVALSVESQDSLEYIKAFKEEMDLDFVLGKDFNRLLMWSFMRYFGDISTGSYSVPGTVYIDQYGFINKAVGSAYTSYDELVQDFEYIINRYK